MSVDTLMPSDETRFTINDYDMHANTVRRVMPIAGPEVDAVDELVDAMIADGSETNRAANIGRELLDITVEITRDLYYQD